MAGFQSVQNPSSNLASDTSHIREAQGFYTYFSGKVSM